MLKDVVYNKKKRKETQILPGKGVVGVVGGAVPRRASWWVLKLNHLVRKVYSVSQFQENEMSSDHSFYTYKHV